MSYRFTHGEEVARGLQRMAREQIDRAVTEIDTRNTSYHERVHQVRKRCKKLRAIARLARPALGDQYGRINTYYRDVARPFSAVRDAHAMVESFDDVVAEREDASGAGDLAPVRGALVARRETVTGAADVGALLQTARDQLLAGREAIDLWRLDGDGFPALAGGVGRVYQRGRKAMRRALDDPSPVVWHEWRKRAKYLWYQLRMLRPLWPGPLRALRDEADRLADLLGDDHDTHVFGQTVEADPDLAALPQTPSYRDLLARRSAALRTEAARLGARLYAEKPKRFVKRLKAYDSAGSVLG